MRGIFTPLFLLLNFLKFEYNSPLDIHIITCIIIIRKHVITCKQKEDNKMGNWTMEELREAQQRARALIRESASRCDFEMVEEYSECLARIEEQIARKIEAN